MRALHEHEKPFDEIYDNEDDVYYVTFKTGEPSRTEEIDDTFMVEIGMFTGAITGFRMLGYSKNKGKLNFRHFKVKLDKKINESKSAFTNIIQDRKAIIKKALQEVF